MRADRLTIEVYFDILRSIHMLRKAGRRVTLYNVGRRAYLPNGRLRTRLQELQEMGLVDSERIVTPKGYEYCEAYLKHVASFLRKYGLREGARRDFLAGL